jgi:hypothetical protein
MAKTWTVSGKSQSEVKSMLEKELGAAEVPSFAAVTWEGNNLKVNISKAGKSQFTMSLEQSASGTVIREVDRSVAMMHKPFVSVVEKFVSNVMEKIGKPS